nr:unnamed protein product [Callosobruchus analis]
MNLDLVSLLEPDIIALKLIGFWKSSKDVSPFNRFYYKIYRGVVAVSIVVYIIFGFMYLYEKRETLTLVDFNSVMFIHTTGVTNPMMVVSIFLNIERLHAMILTTGPILATLQGKVAPLATYIPPWIHWRVYFWFQATITVYNATMASIYVSILTTLLIEAIIQVACLKERLQCTEDKKQLVTFIELVFMIPYLTELIMIIYIHCFYGSILASECEGIAYSLFSSKWINSDVSHKRTIVMFMMFSKKQLTIKLAGGMLTMTLPLFVQVLSIIFYREMQ